MLSLSEVFQLFFFLVTLFGLFAVVLWWLQEHLKINRHGKWYVLKHINGCITIEPGEYVESQYGAREKIQMATGTLTMNGMQADYDQLKDELRRSGEQVRGMMKKAA